MACVVASEKWMLPERLYAKSHYIYVGQLKKAAVMMLHFIFYQTVTSTLQDGPFRMAQRNHRITPFFEKLWCFWQPDDLVKFVRYHIHYLRNFLLYFFKTFGQFLRAEVWVFGAIFSFCLCKNLSVVCFFNRRCARKEFKSSTIILLFFVG